MRRSILLSTLVPLLLPVPLMAAGPVSRPIGLAPHPGSRADAAARALVADDLAEAKRAGESPLVLTATAVLGQPRDPSVLFVQLQSPRECGSAGCSTSAFQPVKGGGWRKVLDAVSGPVKVETTQHGGMRDLTAGDSRFVWTGTAYQDTAPAPALPALSHPAPRPAPRPGTRHAAPGRTH